MVASQRNVAFANPCGFAPYREPCHRTSGSGERSHISETLRLDARLSQVAVLEPRTLRLTNHYHDRFATRADKREGANSTFVHIAQVTTVLGSEG